MTPYHNSSKDSFPKWVFLKTCGVFGECMFPFGIAKLNPDQIFRLLWCLQIHDMFNPCFPYKSLENPFWVFRQLCGNVLQIHFSRTAEDATEAQAALDEKAGTGYGVGWEGTVGSGYVKAFRSDVDMMVLRKHWSLDAKEL